MAWQYYSASDNPLSQDTAERIVRVMRQTAAVHEEHDFNTNQEDFHNPGNANSVASWAQLLMRKTNSDDPRQHIKFACREQDPGNPDSIDVVLMFHWMIEHNRWATSIGIETDDFPAGPLPPAMDINASPANDRSYRDFVGHNGNPGELDEPLFEWHLDIPSDPIHIVGERNTVETSMTNYQRKIAKVEFVADEDRSNWELVPGGNNPLTIQRYGRRPDNEWGRGAANSVYIFSIRYKYA